MSLVAVLDVIAFLAFGVAIVFMLRVPVQSPAVGRPVKYTMIAVAAMYFAVSFSNILEHAGITAALDVYEDFAEIMYVPLVAWAIFNRVGAERLLDAHQAEEAVRREHELLMSIVETTPTGILVADAEGTVSFANDVADFMLARALDGQLDLRSIVGRAPESHLRVPIGEGPDMLYLAVRATALGPGEEERDRAVIVLADVTDRVRNENAVEEYRQDLERAIDRRTSELLEANRQLQHASAAKQQFMTKMSHELKTPLNSIIGFSDLMLKGMSGPITDEQTTQLRMIRTSGTQLLDLVNDVLEISRIEGGYSPVSISQVNICARMRELVDSMGGIAASREIDLSCECSTGPMIATDPDKIDQIIRNLVSNAVKFTDPGGRIVVKVTPDTDCVVIAVADTGIGVAAEDTERIFEAFQQVDTPDRVRPDGTGLGLMICRELCTALGCALTLESAPGAGSVFTVSIPRQFPGHLVIL